MQTYAAFLATLSVKALTEIVKQAGITGYSKLRKSELVSVIVELSATAEVEAMRDDLVITINRHADEARARQQERKGAPMNEFARKNYYRVQRSGGKLTVAQERRIRKATRRSLYRHLKVDNGF